MAAGPFQNGGKRPAEARLGPRLLAVALAAVTFSASAGMVVVLDGLWYSIGDARPIWAVNTRYSVEVASSEGGDFVLLAPPPVEANGTAASFLKAGAQSSGCGNTTALNETVHGLGLRLRGTRAGCFGAGGGQSYSVRSQPDVLEFHPGGGLDLGMRAVTDVNRMNGSLGSAWLYFESNDANETFTVTVRLIFGSCMSHELRVELNGTAGWTQVQVTVEYLCAAID